MSQETSPPPAAGDINDRPIRIRSVPTGHVLVESSYYSHKAIVLLYCIAPVFFFFLCSELFT